MNMKKKLAQKLNKKSGFTLIEMLIVVAIIAILVVVSIPVVNASLDKARTATDEANMRAAKSAAIIQYMDDANSVKKVYYYDAAEGNVKPNVSDIVGYNQKAQDNDSGSTINAKKGCIKVTIEADGEVVASETGWVTAGTPGN